MITMLKALLNKTTNFSKCKKQFFSSNLINLGILAHIDAGKTTISEDILFHANEIKVKGNINDQNTQLDFLKQERERGITIKTAYSCFFWKHKIINLIDTPGHIDFSNELFLSLCVSDKCTILIDAKESVQIQTINIFRYIKEHIPIYFFLNKMDIYETDIEYNLNSLKNNLSEKSVLVTFPIYVQKKLKYILDLPSMLFYYYPPIKYGHKRVYKKFPFDKLLSWDHKNNYKKQFSFIESLKEEEETKNEESQDVNINDIINENDFLSDEIINTILKKREELIETLCDLDNQIEYKYINNITIKCDEFKKKLYHHIKKKNIFPVFSGSALKSIGVNLLLDYVTEGTAKTVGTAKTAKTAGTIGIDKTEENVEEKEKSSFYLEEPIDYKENSKNDKTVLFIFKLINEKNGYNAFCKVMNGTLKRDSQLFNLRNNNYEHIKNIYKVKADRYIITKALETNDIGMVRGMENVHVCDILCEQDNQQKFDIMSSKVNSQRNSKKNENENVNHKKKEKENDETNKNNIRFVKQMFESIKKDIPNKEFWYFLKNYKKRIRQKIIVCKCAVEPIDMKKEKELKNVINQICLEDNSIQAYVDKNNKLIIGSIGILNIEVVLDKIKSEYKIDLKTSEVETVRKEYILGSYHNEIKKRMKLGSQYSNIEVSISIKEKEFLDIINYVQNILKYDTVSQFLASTNQRKQNMPILENHLNDKELKQCEPNIHSNTEENMKYISNSKMSIEKIQNRVMNNISLKMNNEQIKKCKQKYSFEQDPNINNEYNFEKKINSTMTTECKEQPAETETEDEEIGKNINDNEDVDEYLLNINYEQLFQSDVLVDPSVKEYIEKLKQKNSKKKNIYDDIIKSCVGSLKNCLSNGHTTNENIINTEIKITKLKIYDDSTPAVAKYACNDLYYKMMKKLDIQLADPIALVQIQTNEFCVGIIVKDLIQNRKGSIIQIMKNKKNTNFQIMKIFAIMPVEHTHNYVSVLRAISSGHADFYMTCCGYKKR